MQKKHTGSDRSGDRFLHNLVSAHIAGVENMKRDACVDAGVQQHGSRHRSQFPHRNIAEMTAYMTWRDFIDGRKPDPLVNLRLAAGHVLVDSLPSSVKKKMQLINSLSNILR